jgi:putative hydrolase of the HAD superfamily
LKKPSPEIFRYVLQDSLLDPAETLFIDDTLIHVEGAKNAGIHGCFLEIEKGEQVTDMFV